MERLQKKEKDVSSGSDRPKIVFFACFAFLSLLYGVLLLSLPMYEVNIGGVGYYRNFVSAFSLLDEASRYLFLIALILGVVALVAASVLLCLCIRLEIKGKPDSSDRLCMSGMLTFVIATCALGFVAFGLSLWMLMISGILLAVLGLVAIFLYYKKLALLSDD